MKNCEICGKLFEDQTKNHMRKYCSSSCRYKAFHKNNAERLSIENKERYYRLGGREYAKTWRHQNRDKTLKIYKRANEKRRGTLKIQRLEERKRVLQYISKTSEIKCAHCGLTDVRALQIDHINGGGNQEAKTKFRSNTQFGYWKYILSLPREEAQKIYQPLCANCNMIKVFTNSENKRPKN